MSRFIAVIALAAAALAPELAYAADASVQEGRSLVNQHCAVCHTKPDVNTDQYGPSLDQSLLQKASEADVRKVISEGAPDMPGFAYTFAPAQIDSIVAYIKQTPAAAPKRAPKAAGQSPAASDGDN